MNQYPSSSSTVRLAGLALATCLFLQAVPASAALVALVNSPTGNATFLSNFQAFIEARGDTFVRNPASYTGVNVIFNIRQPVDVGMATWVQNGGLLITEYTGIKNAGTSLLIDYTDTGGGNAGSGTVVSFSATGMAMGLSAGLGTSYSDAGSTEFFRNGIVIGPTVSLLASRPLTGGGTTPAIVGAASGQGYVLGLAYDWADAFVATPPTASTRQLITNALAIPVPESGSAVLTMIPGLALLLRRSRRHS